LPGTTQLPLLGRLFSSQRSDRNKTEIVLLITPRVVRNLGQAAAPLPPWPAGTESAVGAAPLQLRGGARVALPLPTVQGAPAARPGGATP